MKKICLLIIAVFTFSFVSAQEQAVKANPIGIAFGVANAGYEFSIKDSQTLTLSALYYNISDISGFGVGAEYRFYFSSNEALRGWHAGPSVGYFSLSDDFDNSAGFFSIAGEVGHQWILKEHFLIDTFAGIGLITGSSDGLTTSVSSTSISIGVSLGYAW